MRFISPAIEWAHRIRSVRSDGMPSHRRELQRAFVRLAWKRSLRRRSRRHFENRERVLNFVVDFVDFDSFYYLFEEIFLDQLYDFPTEEARPFILDCGSNIGLSLLYFKYRYPGARIVAFEPGPQVFSLLQKNIVQNSLEGIEIVRAALSDKEGVADFYEGTSGWDSLKGSCLEARGQGTRVQVPTVPLSRYADRAVDFLKMDIEGAENGVLHELEDGGKLQNIRRLAVEFHHNIAGSGQQDRLVEIFRLLERNNFVFNLAAKYAGLHHGHSFQDVMIYASHLP